MPGLNRAGHPAICQTQIREFHGGHIVLLQQGFDPAQGEAPAGEHSRSPELGFRKRNGRRPVPRARVYPTPHIFFEDQPLSRLGVQESYLTAFHLHLRGLVFGISPQIEPGAQHFDLRLIGLNDEWPARNRGDFKKSFPPKEKFPGSFFSKIRHKTEFAVPV